VTAGRSGPIRVSICLVPGFSLTGVASTIEPLRIANRVTGREAFSWSLVSVDGAPAEASSGIVLSVDRGLEAALKAIVRDEERPDFAFVVAGLDVEKRRYPLLLRWLKALAKRKVMIGGISTGAHILAEAGLLEGHRCTMHWENIPAFTERFPGIEVRQELCVIDGNLLTCAGGTSAIDMMLHVIASNLDQVTAAHVAEQLIMPAVRPLDQHQRGNVGLGLRRTDPRLSAAVRCMEESIAQRVGVPEIARALGLSRRQLERLFERDLGMTPARYLRELRLERSRHLLQQTRMPVIEIAMACGFASAAHFSRSFRRRYGTSPKAAR
jgi:transcriptional regulator GlxA family with amidase domain